MSELTINKHFTNIPDEFPTSGQDWANHIAGFYNSDTLIKVVLELESHLDLYLMKKAIRISIDAVPVLGCSFEERDSEPVWKRFINIDAMEWCLFEESQNQQASLKNFLISSFLPNNRQFQTKLIRTDSNDILCLVFNHACTDAAGIKDYLNILSEIYNNLIENKDYYPVSNAFENMDTQKIFKNLGISNLSQDWNPKQEASAPTWAFPYNKVKKQSLKVAVHKLNQKEFKSLYLYAKERDATINDLIMTAFYRALFVLIKTNDLEPMEITTTADLRRYLPTKKAQSICNLSGKINMKLMKINNETFDGTLNRISLMMKNLKKNNPGINNAIAMELLRGMGYKNVSLFLENSSKKAIANEKSSPLFSNMGIIAKYPLKMGNSLVKDAYIVSPAGYPPNFIFAFGSYNDILTMTVSYYEPTTSTEDITHFFNLLTNELSLQL
ncbi:MULTISPECIES: hypothetical protein [Bacillus]|uniref:Condensation domain-containing protein n=2 Tax=Bacillus wiedmannii TaxID=1890302 RepID=A0A2B5I463_9BACI|nr:MULTISPECIES: hypothetical protein [Bacillus]MDF9663741.1 hypothetical protein [Bacillus wiedmannii]MDI6504802.1 hypothetical protein [Bacillus wiedmannii]MDI6510703.1 hypothetical protein [Bacillus wiedmannii]PFZ20138.1 hypothetical protein COL51_27560 [Bacillus wiedmannii]PGC15340.1 hypothetical protein COM08_23945 [Bacillus wiedmannii]